MDEGKQTKGIVTLKKRWNWSNSTKFALSATWTHCRLERLNGIQWSWVQLTLTPTFYSYFEESVSGDYHMYQLILLHSCDYLWKTSIKIKVTPDEGKHPKQNVTLNIRWNWSSCAKLLLSASTIHDPIAQWDRATKWNSVVVGSNHTQANFL